MTEAGIESPVEMYDGPQIDEMEFLPSSTGEAGGVAGSFEDMFPKGPTGSPRQRIVDIAKTMIGTPYEIGGDVPRQGLDGAGLVRQVYKQMGFKMPHLAAAQARAGRRIKLNELQPGDLVGWDHNPRNKGGAHIAIHIGDGQIIESPRPGLGVRIRSLDDDEGDAWGVRLEALDY